MRILYILYIVFILKSVIIILSNEREVNKMKRFWITYEMSVLFEANSKEEAIKMFNEGDCDNQVGVSDTTIVGVEEEEDE